MSHTPFKQPLQVVLVPPPVLPLPQVQGGAVETLLTHLMEQNEQQGLLSLVCASIPHPQAQQKAAGYRHTKILYLPQPSPHPLDRARAIWQRCQGMLPPSDPWYNAVLDQLRQGPRPDFLVAEGGNPMQFGALSRWAGPQRCLFHLHGHSHSNPYMDRMFGGILALSHFLRSEYLATSQLQPQAAHLVHNCIDCSRFTPGTPDGALRRSLGLAPEDFVVLYCGRDIEEKGIEPLMDAIALLGDTLPVKLLIVGSPFFAQSQESPFLTKLKTKAQALGSRIQFTGFVPNEQLPQYYRCANVCCIPTLVEEAAGLVCMEAMACGIPVIATESGGMPEYLAGSKALVLPRTPQLPQLLAQAIHQLYQSPQQCREMALAGTAVAQRYSPQAFYREFVAALHAQQALIP